MTALAVGAVVPSLPSWSTSDSFLGDINTLFCKHASTVPGVELTQSFRLVVGGEHLVAFEVDDDPYIMVPDFDGAVTLDGHGRSWSHCKGYFN